jgi:hypothetical protein
MITQSTQKVLLRTALIGELQQAENHGMIHGNKVLVPSNQVTEEINRRIVLSQKHSHS